MLVWMEATKEKRETKTKNQKFGKKISKIKIFFIFWPLVLRLKNMLDKIPWYRRTTLKEECLYMEKKIWLDQNWFSHKVLSVMQSFTESWASHRVLSVPRSLERPTESWASHGVLSVPRSLERPTESCASHRVLRVLRSLERPTESWASHEVLSVPRSLERPTESWASETQNALELCTTLKTLRKNIFKVLDEYRHFSFNTAFRDSENRKYSF